jgi:ribosomal protein uL23
MSEEKQTKETEKKEVKVETKQEKKTEVKKIISKLNSFGIIKYPLSTEKSLRLMESENKLIFVVDKKASKQDIKKAIEDIFKAKVLKINTLINQDGDKRAYVKFSMETPAIDIATNMGLM